MAAVKLIQSVLNLKKNKNRTVEEKKIVFLQKNRKK
jgi:hypothetical protein